MPFTKPEETVLEICSKFSVEALYKIHTIIINLIAQKIKTIDEATRLNGVVDAFLGRPNLTLVINKDLLKEENTGDNLHE